MMVSTRRLENPKPKRDYVVWAEIPSREEAGSVDSQNIYCRSPVAVSPGIGFGQYGEAHVRFALIETSIAQASRAKDQTGRWENC